MSKTPAVIDKSSGEVVPANFLAGLEADADKRQTFRQEDLIIPRINMLQDLSPQVKKRSSDYIEGAEVGMIYNSVTNSLDTEVQFIPCVYNVRFVAWKPRPAGGLVDQDIDEKRLGGEFKPDGIGRWTGMMQPHGEENPVKVEIIETPEWAGIIMGQDGRLMPAVISFPSTKAKAVRKMNSEIEATEVNVGSEDAPKIVTPPAFYHRFTLATATETSGDNEWFGWRSDHGGLITDMEDRGFLKARDLHSMLTKGEASMADMSDTDS